MHANSGDQHRYQENWHDLNLALQSEERKRGRLSDALEALFAQQFETGFVRDNLDRLQRFTFQDVQNTERHFRIQYNPRRAQRFAGAGRTTPPLGTTSVNDGCFLCPGNIEWQQSGVELGYELTLNERDYIAWMNPYPLMPIHTVIASRSHIPQAWKLDGGAQSQQLDLAAVIGDLIAVARRAPGYIAFYNGQGAGASIPTHLHFQMFRRLNTEDKLPIETIVEDCVTDEEIFTTQYPVHFAFWQGSDDGVISRSTTWIDTWVQQHAAPADQLTANIIAIVNDDLSSVRLYFVPRLVTRSRSAEMSGLIGGLEILGELVFSSADEKQRLESGNIDYDSIERILAAVCTPIALT